jgi:eukaryotic-like serine/threonine-protein kinase
MGEGDTMKKTIGKYELIGRVAQGGMGTLYTARHPTLERTVLLKKLSLGGGSGIVERFRREARLMMDLNSERIVQVYDHFKEGTHYYIVEEFVEGMSLDALIRRERYLSNEAAMVILYETCRALKFAHDRQVIHRDIKPGNILISSQGEVKLADFGIATSLDEEGDGLTKDGTMLGTPAYIPPEQIDDAKNVDRRADIYSLGIVLYEMLTGKTPYPGSFTAETLRLIHRGKYIPPRKLNPKASRFLCSIAATCMRVKRRRRYRDLGVIIRLLEKKILVRDTVSLRAAVKRIVKGGDVHELFRRRASRLFWPLAAAFLVFLLGMAGLYLWRQGLWYEAFAANRYGALVVSVRVEKGYKDPDEVFFKPVLYREEGDGLARVAGLDFGLEVDPARSAGDSFEISSRTMYLEAGRYRLKASLEGQLTWMSFTLAPRTTQRETLATLNGRRITVRLAAEPTGPLVVHWRALDADTGEDITGGSHAAVFLGGRWEQLPLAKGESLSPGRTWRFRVLENGYLPQTFDLVVGPYQALLTIEASLRRYP